MKNIKKYIDWLVQDGLFWQICFGLFGLLFLFLGGALAFLPFIEETIPYEMSLKFIAIGLLWVCFVVGFLWWSVVLFSVLLLHPSKKLAKIGRKLDSGEPGLIFIVIPVLILVSLPLKRENKLWTNVVV